MAPDASALLVPRFARLDEYAGVWAYEPSAFASLWGAAKRMDLAAHVAGPLPPRPATTVDMVPGKGGSGIAVARVSGTLMKQQPSLGGTSTVQLRRDIRAATNDPNVSAILLAIDSPGGTVAGTADLATDIKAARRKKPVWAHVDDLGASAAYWLASQCEMIYANAATALVGSIGVLQAVYDYSAAAERDGVKTLVFRTGPLKGIGAAPGDPVTDEQAAHLQALVNETHAHFVKAVRDGRGMTAAQVAAVTAGGVFSAADAVSLRLIDGVRGLDATLAALAAAK